MEKPQLESVKPEEAKDNAKLYLKSVLDGVNKAVNYIIEKITMLYNRLACAFRVLLYGTPETSPV